MLNVYIGQFAKYLIINTKIWIYIVNLWTNINTYRRKASIVPYSTICHLGRVWNRTYHSLGMSTARRTYRWVYDSSHCSHVHHLWSCIFLLPDKNAREAYAWISGHIWPFSPGIIIYVKDPPDSGSRKWYYFSRLSINAL